MRPSFLGVDVDHGPGLAVLVAHHRRPLSSLSQQTLAANHAVHRRGGEAEQCGQEIGTPARLLAKSHDRLLVRQRQTLRRAMRPAAVD